MKSIYKIRMMVAAGFMLAATSCSDFSDYNSVPDDMQPSSNQTLWQNITSNGNLKDFAAIAKKAGYEKVFSLPNYYTVWAPLDGTYDAQSILSKDSATIADEFMQQHIAQYSHLVSGENTERVVSLNDKVHNFSSNSYDDIEIEQANVASSNGVLHVLKGISEFHPNLYQQIDRLEGCNNFKDYIQKYDEYYLDPSASVIGPMVNGQQTYLDSVFKKRNNVIEKILNAKLENEDSTYTMLVPNDAAWNLAYDEIKNNFNYLKSLTYMDMSLNSAAAASVSATTGKCAKPEEIDNELYTDSLTKRFIVGNLLYSNTYDFNSPIWTGVQSSDKLDTLVTTTNTEITNIKDIYSHTVGETEKNSNGYTRVLDSLCYLPWETYQPVRTYRTPIRVLGLATGKSYATHNIIKSTLASRDTLFEGVPEFIKKMMLPDDSQFLTYISTDKADLANTNTKSEIDIALKGLLSTKYHIFVVTAPAQLLEPETEELKPMYLRFDLSYTDATGAQKFQRLNKPGNKLSDDIITTPGKFTVIEMEFNMPICYYGLSKAYPTLFISHTKAFTTAINRNKYDQEIRIVGVYLVPEQAYNYYKKIYNE